MQVNRQDGRPAASVPRVALFADSFLEVNGLARTCRQLHAYARSHGYPFLTFYSGTGTRSDVDGSAVLSQLALSRVALPLDVSLKFDPLFIRHYRRVRAQLQAFQPDVVHFTAPSHCSLLGAIAARRLGIPRVGSWHTNVHEFASLRLAGLLSGLPRTVRRPLSAGVERATLAGLFRFYRTARLVLAPNEELARSIAAHTGNPTRIMSRGVDTTLFSPAHRARADGTFTLGFVGRLVPEKNLRLLQRLEQTLQARGHREFRFVLVGEGSERRWLEAHLQRVEFPGVLDGEALASAYANFDLLVFPSRSDTFGQVVQEAHASGVPAVVTSAGGPKFLVTDGVDGFVARDDDDFIERVLQAMNPATDLPAMRLAARRRAEQASWEHVFDTLYEDYAACARRQVRLKPGTTSG